MKLGMNVILLAATQTSYILHSFSLVINNMAYKGTCEVGAILVTLNSWNYSW
jgi:hypothetical protein